MSELWIGLDTGGTYTDAVALDGGHRVIASAGRVSALVTSTRKSKHPEYQAEKLRVGCGGPVMNIDAPEPQRIVAVAHAAMPGRESQCNAGIARGRDPV